MKRIYLIRHCQAAGQEPEAPLTTEGVRQAKELRDFLAHRGIERIVASPYLRAVSTIRPLAELLQISVHTDARLQERVLCSYDMIDWLDKLKETYADIDLKYEGGESSREAMNRGLEVIDEALESTKHNIAIVTHGNLMSLLLNHFTNDFGFEEWERLTNPDVYELHIFKENDNITVSRIWL
ncbi:histidine phosphatase family protein [Paenibacillus profundus]|uniref:Histidine phosphatase family protein n=1 Tax=Paenibacillus profundus TaxID=1173085 RepID=A0ABS8YGH7_9BACL|nr:histidine phosphatase family protein [Paenibacillus profundus]MCE5170836.1 histidine phosphatase family protein [Paenibacillus profundus]